MEWLKALDVEAFRQVNEALASPLLDRVIPWFSGNALFGPAVVVLLVGLVCRGGWRGRWFSGLLLLTLVLTDTVLVAHIKTWVARERPFSALPDARLLLGRGGEFASFPSAHSANTMAAWVLALAFYPRAARWTWPVVGLVGFSRVYCGVHYPGDVLGGWLAGATVAGAVVGGARLAWECGARAWFPAWWATRPQLLGAPSGERPPVPDDHWTRGALLVAALLLGARLAYLAAAVIQLSEDEAYQWLWSKRLDWCYFSKPPGIAVAQWIGTGLFGDTELGVRFLSPVLAFVLGAVLVRFLSREASGKTAFWFQLAVAACPLVAVGSVLITVDPLLVFFATLGWLAGWRAIVGNSTAWWIAAGVCWAGAMLVKFAAPFLWAGAALAIAFDPAARRQARRPGPWLALAISLAAAAPILIWNQSRGWPTLHHLEDRGGLNEAWRFRPDFLFDFALVVPLLLNPVFFAAIVHAAVGVWRRPDSARADAGPDLLRYLFWMGGAVFFFYLAYTLRARVQPNWIAGAILPWMVMAALYWHRRTREGSRAGPTYLAFGLGLGLPIVVLLHEPNLIAKVIRRPLPARFDPTKRVRAYDELARVVEAERSRLAAETGRPVFVIADHYGRAGLLSFYDPAAKAAVVGPEPRVTVRSSDGPENQFWFWPEFRYGGRKGQNAIYVSGTGREEPAPARLAAEFGEVRSLGLFRILRHGEVFHTVQLFACRDLK